MPSDVDLMIFDPRLGAVVAAPWLGGNLTTEKLMDVVRRPPDYSELGYECWGRIAAMEAGLIAEAGYVDGATPDEVAALSRTFPDSDYWWMITWDY